jgi:hypothetical protein
MHVTKLLLKWISRSIHYKKKFREPLQPTSKCNKITMKLRTNQEPCAHKHSHINYKHLWTFTSTSKDKAYTLREYIYIKPHFLKTQRVSGVQNSEVLYLGVFSELVGSYFLLLLTRTDSPNLEAAFKLSNAADADDWVMDSFLPFVVTERTLLLSSFGEMPGSSHVPSNLSIAGCTMPV